MSDGGGRAPKANLRYTTRHSWHIMRRDVRPTMPVLCQRIRNIKYFCGPTFSVGDEWMHNFAGKIASKSGSVAWTEAVLRAGRAHCFHLHHALPCAERVGWRRGYLATIQWAALIPHMFVHPESAMTRTVRRRRPNYRGQAVQWNVKEISSVHFHHRTIVHGSGRPPEMTRPICST